MSTVKLDLLLKKLNLILRAGLAHALLQRVSSQGESSRAGRSRCFVDHLESGGAIILTDMGRILGG
jgi:hypothetical protein